MFLHILEFRNNENNFKKTFVLLYVCNKRDKIWYIFINKEKKPAKLCVSAERRTQKNVEAFHPTLENVYYLLLKS